MKENSILGPPGGPEEEILETATPSSSVDDKRRPAAILVSVAAMVVVMLSVTLLALLSGYGGFGRGTGTGNFTGSGRGLAPGPGGLGTSDHGTGTGAGKSGSGAGAAGAEKKVEPRRPGTARVMTNAPATVTRSEPLPPPSEVVLLDSPAENQSPPVVANADAEGEAGVGGGGGGPLNLGTGDVSFRMYWQPAIHDVDLHVIDPEGHHLWYQALRCSCEGEMDRDDTCCGGPENVYWPKGKGPKGRYTFYVVYFSGMGPKTVVIEVRRDGEVAQTLSRTLHNVNDETEHFVYSTDK